MEFFSQKYCTRTLYEIQSFFCPTGDTGIGIQTWVESVLDGGLNFPHLRVLYPTAPPRYYT